MTRTNAMGSPEDRSGITPVSVAGGYWTGSSAIVDLLREHSDCRVVPGEFVLFSFGQFFQEVCHPLIAGQPLGIGYDQCLHRLEEFNRREMAPLLRGAARRACASIGVYPPIFFARRGGMGRLLGKDYREACDRLVVMLRRARETRMAPELTELMGRLQAVLDEAIQGIPPGGAGGVKIGVFDQLVGPPYTEYAAEALPGLRYINVDRDWRDQYISLRGPFRRMVSVNRRLAVRPWDEEPTETYDSAVGYFVRLRKRMDQVKSRHARENRKDVLWLQFEDIVRHPDEAAEKVFALLGLDPAKWTRGIYFRPEVSSRRVGKWRLPEWQQGPVKDEIQVIAGEIGEPR